MPKPQHQDETLERGLGLEAMSPLDDPKVIEIIERLWQALTGTTKRNDALKNILSATRIKSIINFIITHLDGNVLCCDKFNGAQQVTYRTQQSKKKTLSERCTQLVT
jgi:hypothetical protein